FSLSDSTTFRGPRSERQRGDDLYLLRGVEFLYAERNDACAFIHAPTDEDVTAFIRLDGNRLQRDHPGVSVDDENRRTIALIEQCGERETRDPFAGGVGQGQCRRHPELHCITGVRN